MKSQKSKMRQVRTVSKRANKPDNSASEEYGPKYQGSLGRGEAKVPDEGSVKNGVALGHLDDVNKDNHKAWDFPSEGTHCHCG